jgi:uncharacterized protein (TIGR04255 family)
MTQPAKPLPSFVAPPVVEVVLGVQFEPIKGLRTPQIGLLWQEFKDRLPVTQEQPPLDPIIERFGVIPKPPKFSLQMLEAPPPPRCWFLNSSGTELIQIQPDRFIRNWRQIDSGNEYPRYEKLQTAFAEEFRKFLAFLQREKLGPFIPNQCEVTYVNHVLPCDVWQNHGQLEKIITNFKNCYSDDFLRDPEYARMAISYVIPDTNGNPIGRLHITADPVYRDKDDIPMFRLNLTARGRPKGDDIADVLQFLDVGRDWVVRGFASITTREMQRIWRRQDGR